MLSMSAAKALAELRQCTGSSESLMFAGASHVKSEDQTWRLPRLAVFSLRLANRL